MKYAKDTEDWYTQHLFYMFSSSLPIPYSWKIKSFISETPLQLSLQMQLTFCHVGIFVSG